MLLMYSLATTVHKSGNEFLPENQGTLFRLSAQEKKYFIIVAT